MALAIITDKRPKNEALFYTHSFLGTESVYRYNNLVLADLNDEELLLSENPIDLVLYAAKHAVSSRKDLQRYNYLRRTAGLLAARGWDSGEKRRLLLFIERILYLKDESLSTQYREYRQQLSEEGKMMYIPFYERSDAEKVRLEGIEKGIERGIERGIEKGIERGIERGKEEMARKLLVRGDYAPEVISEIAGLPLDRIRALMN